jgi:hypothetical protein
MKTADLDRICREYTAELVEAVRNEKDDKRLLEYFEFCARFHNYSFQNRILIWLSRPDATFVAGFRAWRKMGRFVKKGQKGIPIFAPMRIKVRKGEEWDPELQFGSEDQGSGDNVQEEILRFKVVYVWDVSQTEGDPLPEQPDVMSVEGELGELLPSLESVLASQGITLQYVDALPRATMSGMSTGGTVKIIATMKDEEKFHVLAHELGHELLHGPQERQKLSKKVKELEAEAIAYVVSRHFGLKMKAPTYLALYRVEEVDIMGSLDRIVSTASRIIRELVREQIKESLEEAA